MGTGYTRNDASNNIANGNVIDAADLDGEFDAIESAFGTSGHSHDGTSAEGGAITNLGPSQEFKGDGSSLYPKADATYDLGKSSASFSTAYIESLNLGGTGITATATEINYTDTVTSNIQTQLNGKQAANANIVIDANYVATDQNFTDADHTKLNGIAASATNTAVPAIASNGTTPSLASGISAAEVRSLIGAGTSSSDNATHSGDVTGSSTLTIASNVVDADNLAVSGNGSSTQFLRSDGDGTFTWAVPVNTNTTYSVGDGGLTQNNFTDADHTKLNGIAASATNTAVPAIASNGTTPSLASGISAAEVRSLIGAGTSSSNNATHTGEVTGSSALTVADNVIDAGNLKVTGNGSTSQFLRSDGDGTFTWATPTDTNTNTTYSGGDGISLSGTTFNIEDDLRSHVSQIGKDTNDYIAVGTTEINFVLDGNLDMRLENDGDLHVDGNVVAYSTTTSDERLKKDIVKIDNAMDKVMQLNGYTFEYIHDGKKSGGIIAQEVEAVMPSAVTEMKLPLKSDDDKEYKVVQYDQLHGLLIEAIKELKAEIEVLKGK